MIAAIHLSIGPLTPEFGYQFVVWGGWLLTLLGVLKLVIWSFGEFVPRVYSRIPSENLRNLFTGKTNRLVFGLGGFVTALLGLVFVALGTLFERLFAS